MRATARTLATLSLSSFLAAACAARAVPVEIELPRRAPLEEVTVHGVSKDGICPGDAHLYMSREAFQALLRNVTNTEVYILQLESLLKSLSAPK